MKIVRLFAALSLLAVATACAADRGAIGRAWRAAHPADVAAYNARRRVTA